MPIAPPTTTFRERANTELAKAIPERTARLSWDHSQLAAHQRDRLRELLAYAVERSPFYRERLRGIDPATFELDRLSSLLVLTKHDLMANFDAVVTDPQLTRQLAEDAIAKTGNEPHVISEKYVALVTGGSSGQRGLFIQDAEAYVDMQASILRNLVPQVMQMGVPAGGFKMALVAAPAAVHATGLAAALNRGSQSPVLLQSVPATLRAEQQVALLNAMQPHGITGYPTVLARLAREQQAGRLRINPRLAGTTSENLTPELRTAIRDAFGTPLVDVFGSTEGLVGATAPDDATFVFNSDICIVELVDDAGDPVRPGTPSSRILVTNLSNRIQPLIRYEMRDRFTQQPDDPRHGFLRATVEGRADDLLGYGPIVVHPHAVRSVLLREPAIIDFIATQTANGLEIEIEAAGELDTSAIAHKVAANLQQAGLDAPEVSVHVSRGLTRDSGTGKLRRIVPLPAVAGSAA